MQNKAHGSQQRLEGSAHGPHNRTYFTQHPVAGVPAGWTTYNKLMGVERKQTGKRTCLEGVPSVEYRKFGVNYPQSASMATELNWFFVCLCFNA